MWRYQQQSENQAMVRRKAWLDQEVTKGQRNTVGDHGKGNLIIKMDFQLISGMVSGLGIRGKRWAFHVGAGELEPASKACFPEMGALKAEL